MLAKIKTSPTIASLPTVHSRIYGIIFTLAFALGGWGLSLLPGLDRFGPLACALLLAVAYRHRFRYPLTIESGIRFSSGTLLRLAIVLFGLKLNISHVLIQGLPLLVRSGGTVIFAMVAVLLVGRWLKADRKLTLLLAVGTAICGAAAVAAVSPLLRSKEEDSAISVGMIAMIGTVFAVMYMLIQPWLPMGAEAYGIWSGLTLHEIAHVAMAAAPAGPDAMTDALLAKLCRVALLIPLCLGIVSLSKIRAGTRTEDVQHGAGTRRSAFPFPWFLLGFVATSLFGSYAMPYILPNPAELLNGLSTATTLLLGMAMAGLGFNVSLRDFRARAMRPLLATLIASLLLSGLTFITF
ncbi:YeiH family protein [Cohnella luojiensis]|uniref:Putative sulfate exporter family transporter n=1 Tax=Cohnella luojiensis TaxID=652876 RepID=A0A4Y8M3A4_9BACL|nr:putative sulfate exporter family transporter [Cohnella luojiensis]TFE28928.1 putative sulfate exporter family transporter [Cohnella luojiensis]